MDGMDVILAAVTVAVTGTLAITFAIGWFRASRRVRDLERRLGGAAPDPVLAQLESSLAVLSDHVEQLASGQEFLSRLVTERQPPATGQLPAPGMATPR